MYKYIYPLIKWKIKPWLKYYIVKKGEGTPSEIITGASPITLVNSLRRKFIKFIVGGNSVQDGEPSPINEVPIQNVTGNVEVKVENKNLFDETQLLEADNWTVTNGVYSGIINDWFLKFRNGFNELSFKENTQYTISFKGYTTGGTPRIKITYTDNTTSTLNISALAMTAYLFTTPAGKTILKVSADYGSAGQNTLYLTEFQIEEGSTATDYVPHEEQTAIFPLEEGQVLHEGDTIEDKIVQRRATDVIDENSNIFYISTSKYFSIALQHEAIAWVSKPISNYFGNRINNNKLYIQSSNGISSVWIFDTEGYFEGNVETFKNWLREKKEAGNPLKIEYIVETPIEIPFTEAQRTAKTQIDKLYSYKGTTHITSNNEPSPIFEVQYYMEGE